MTLPSFITESIVLFGVDPSRRFSIVSLLRYLTMVLVLVIGLSMVGINFASLAVI